MTNSLKPLILFLLKLHNRATKFQFLHWPKPKRITALKAILISSHNFCNCLPFSRFGRLPFLKHSYVTSFFTIVSPLQQHLKMTDCSYKHSLEKYSLYVLFFRVFFFKFHANKRLKTSVKLSRVMATAKIRYALMWLSCYIALTDNDRNQLQQQADSHA